MNCETLYNGDPILHRNQYTLQTTTVNKNINEFLRGWGQYIYKKITSVHYNTMVNKHLNKIMQKESFTLLKIYNWINMKKKLIDIEMYILLIEK